MNDLDVVLSRQPADLTPIPADLRREASEPGRVEERATEDRERPHQRLDADVLEERRERPTGGEHHERPVPGRVEARGDQEQLKVRPVAVRGRVEVEDRAGR